MKYILLIGDGMGDTPVASLGNKTPLEAAAKPTIDRLAKASEMLMVRTIPHGYPPGSDVANLSLLGYEPEKYYTGRAPIEAASMGVDLGSDEYAFRCNLVNVEHGADGSVTMIDYSADHITTDEARELIGAVQEVCGSERLTLHGGISYRHLMVHRGDPPPQLTTVPPHDYMDQDVTAFYRQYLETDYFKALLEESGKILANHPVNEKRVADGKRPANCLWLWGEGKRPTMDLIKDRYGVQGGMISAVDLLKGLGVLSGLEVFEIEGATGYLDTNYEGKANAALDVLERENFALVHVEAPDETGHQGLADKKVQAIEDFDSRIVKPIVEEMERRGDAFRLVVTMDHYTPVARRTHEDWPVPMFIYDSRGIDEPAECSYTEDNVKARVLENKLELASGAAFFSRFVEQDIL